MLRPTHNFALFSGKCRTCMDHGLEIDSVPETFFCAKCLKSLAPGVCSRCATNNGELEDFCRNCFTPLTGDLQPTPVRKLKPSTSHPESPQKKSADRKPTTPTTTATHTDIPVPEDQSDLTRQTTRDDGISLDALERLLDKKFHPLQTSVSQVTQRFTNIESRFTDMQTQVHHDFANVNSRVDVLPTQVQQSNTRIETLETQIQQRTEQQTQPGYDPDITNKLKHIEKTISNMQ